MRVDVGAMINSETLRSRRFAAGDRGCEQKTADRCQDCLTLLEDRVLQSAAGWYIGTACACGQYSRESEYYQTRAAAEADLERGVIRARR